LRTESPAAGRLALAAAFVCGALIALQSRMNGTLALTLGGFPAAWVSFGSGLLVLSVLFVTPHQRARVGWVRRALRSGRLRWWQVLGGVGGGLFVGTQTYAVPLLGVATFLLAAIGGQTLSALLVDRQGLGPAPPQALSLARVLSALLAVVGVGVASASADDGAGGVALLPVLLASVAGMGVAVQQAVNGQVATVARDPWATAWVNFATGTATLVLLGAVPVWRMGWPAEWTAPTWAWLGGLCGVAFIALAAWAVQHTGVLLFGLVTVTSQMAVALVLDLADPATRDRVDAQVLTGVVITVVAAVAAGQSARRARLRSLQWAP
jgi:bacterial/archaeal transporter family-2 protein